jgi:N-acetylmuramoyl-L-alanine amidase
VWKTRSKRGVMLIITLALWLTFQATANAAPLANQTTRIWGQTRIETAVGVSKAGWEQSRTVLLARADDFPDSLVSIPLAKRLNAPILLTFPGSLDQKVMDELNRLQAEHVILLGGPGLLGDAITKPLEQANKSWERIGGANRYETAALVAERVGSTSGEAILVSGENFPDALAIGPYAGVSQSPILLTTAAGVPDATRTEIVKLQSGKATPRTLIIGGDGVIPDATLGGIPSVTRIGGHDRYETAAKVYYFSQDKLTGLPDGVQTGKSNAYLVTGQNFPDALVAGALAAKNNAPLFMSSETYLPEVTYSAMGNAAERDLFVTIIGGSGVVSDYVKGIVEGSIQPNYLLGGITIVVDPGHGGPDTGAPGATGTYEKYNTLPVGLALADLLRAAGATVVLTRSTDVSPSGSNYSQANDLQARVDIAKNVNANLFVSIHNNANADPGPNGTETYYSSENPVANQCIRLAKNIQEQVVKYLGLKDRGVKDAPFWVIDDRNPIPSALVELGFNSNFTEANLLKSPDFQNKAALGIYRGILVYMGH